MTKPLVSIIIPTLNRAHLIGETLDSVIAQTYENLECIVVDDGSTDNTEEVMADYITRDPRFQFHHRPKDRLPGGNAARNYGLEVSKGEFIQWFDSDDLMEPNFLLRKLEVIDRDDVDFVVSKSLNFVEKDVFHVKKYKGNLQNELSGKNYVLKIVYWMTPDFLVKKKSLQNYSFDETLYSGQETNFFIVLLNRLKLKGKTIDENLTLRRIHNLTIQQGLKISKVNSNQGKLKALLNAYKEIFNDIDDETKCFMQREVMTTFYKLNLKNIKANDFIGFTVNLTFNRNPLKAFSFFISMILNTYFNVGYKIFEYSRS